MIKHKLSIVTILMGATSFFANSAYAEGQGFYIGASAGYSALNTPGGDAFAVGTSIANEILYVENNSTSDIGGFGGNVFAGYNINQHVAVELGYTKYADSNYSSTQSEYNNISTNPSDPDEYALNGTPNTASLDYSTSSIDLFIKGTMPVIAKISAFAKIGVSYVIQGVDYTNPTGTPDISLDNSKFATPATGSSTEKALRPAAALGLSYKATEHIATSIFAQGFYGSGDFSSDSNAIASAYLIGASLSYSF